MRDLYSQVRKMRPARGRFTKLDEAQRLTEMIITHHKHNIALEDFNKYKGYINNGRKRPDALTTDPVPAGEVGPNGHRIGYTKEGDKVEWLPDEENPGEEWPLVLRRGDKAILTAEQEFMDVIWYDRKLMLQEKLREGSETINPEIHKGMLAAMRKTEKKYGKRKLRNYYKDDFGWGMLNGKLSALRWVLGDDWDMLDT